eukprot:Nitzschia sp. Nitz4//scaffold112_size70979//48852//51327//NITZ4_005908-RA/size70979-augustus-gene-0.87-mRNA-1//1//CDS//3329533283//666//frame0
MEVSSTPSQHADLPLRHNLAASALKLALLSSLGIAALAAPGLSASLAGTSKSVLDHAENHSHLRQSFNEVVVERSLEDQLCCDVDCCMQFEKDICPSDNEWIDAIPFAIQIILIVVLIGLSALFSGLTLGLMSLDKTGLEIVMGGDDAKAAEYAKNIYPVREDGNLLLCTLLLGNVAVNSMLSILLAAYTGGIAGFISSTFLIVIFGEIVPQATCSRYALMIGSATIPLVKVIRIILYPVAKTFAWCLDKVLGEELATTYSSSEMMKMLQIHVQQNVIDQETAGAMTGALTYKNITVKEVMTPMNRTFMLSVDDKLSFETIATIFKTGFSRIPIYEVSRDNIIGLLFVKDLIFIDPEDEVPIRSFVQIFGRGTHVVWPDDKLGDVLAELKKGRTHMALVRDVNNTDETQDPFYEIKGIITLEDIIEKIIGDSIVDETDAFVDNAHEIKVQRAETFEWARLRLLDTKIVDQLLSPSEVQAVTAHFRMNYSESVKLLTDSQLARLVATTPVSVLDAAHRDVGEGTPKDLLYCKGEPCDVFTLVLSGRVTVLVGSEDFRSDLTAWSVLGKPALERPSFIPDFSAYVSDGPCRCLRITYNAFAAAVDASALERNATEHLSKGSPAQPMNGSSHGTSSSPANGSADAPNRREKMLAELFRRESIKNSFADELNPTQEVPTENGVPIEANPTPEAEPIEKDVEPDENGETENSSQAGDS